MTDQEDREQESRESEDTKFGGEVEADREHRAEAVERLKADPLPERGEA